VPFVLPPLPYEIDALEPFLSAETLTYHYGRHHKSYIDALNRLVAADRRLTGKSLVDLIQTQAGPVFQNAAQSWNHAFYWSSMVPGGSDPSNGVLGHAVRRDFGSVEGLYEAFFKAGLSCFGSGWVWLVLDPKERLKVVSTSNADTPVMEPRGDTPLLVMDVWEHAYYLDHQNERRRYIQSFLDVADWGFAGHNLMVRLYG